MMTPRRYILATALLFVGLSSMTVLVNYLVDPYLILGSKCWHGFNAYKVEVNEHLSMSKAYHPLFGEWDTLLVGNSRIELGLDPLHSCFLKSGATVYNLGLPGAGVRRQLGYALNLLYQQPIKRVFLSVDFVDFLMPEGREAPLGEFEWSAPSGSLRYSFDGSVNPEYAWNTFIDYYRALFSLDALFSSLQTVALQVSYQSDRTDQGFNPARDMEHSVAVEGPHALFAQKMGKLESKYSQNWSIRYSDDSRSRDFAILGKFLKIAASRGVQVTIFTNPFHEQFWDLLRDNELYQMHQMWLVELQAFVSTASSVDVPLWDFSADSQYIHEKVPAGGVKSGPLTWFWEPAHYRKELGDLMLDTMLADRCESASQFGSKLL
jgi:hypothetical protein